MTDTVQRRPAPGVAAGPSPRPARGVGVRIAVALACGLLGFLLVAQVRATEELGDRLGTEREEDLARILADVTAQSDRLQDEITELRLTLLGFQSAAESDQLALTSLQRRLDDLRILAGTVPVEGEGVQLTISDPDGLVGQERIVDIVQELRDAGAEAIAVNDVRLVASSAFTTRNHVLLVDGIRLDSPLRIVAIGPGETMAQALAIPGGAEDTLSTRPGVEFTVEVLAQLVLPARGEPVDFVFGQPRPPSSRG